jgi:cytochrome c biogenesis protein CcmG/thiol:disulfide interchange protein DsbE
LTPNNFEFATMRLILPVLFLACAVAFNAGAALKVGDTFPNLVTAKLDGKLPENLSGKVVLVDFWASWCGPCAQSFPVMDELQKKYGSQGLVIVAVSVDEKKSDFDAFLKKHAVSFTVVHDASQKLVEQAGITAMPGSFLMGRDGHVTFVHSGFFGGETRKQYVSEIESLLK